MTIRASIYARVAERLGRDVTDKWWDHAHVILSASQGMDNGATNKRVAVLVGDLIWKLESNTDD